MHHPGVPDQWGPGTSVRGDEGQAIAELVIVPVLLIIIVLMVALGRVDSARGNVESAARPASRQPSSKRTPPRQTRPPHGDQHPGRRRAHLSCSPDHDVRPTSSPEHRVGERDLCDQPGDVSVPACWFEDPVGHRVAHIDVFRTSWWHMRRPCAVEDRSADGERDCTDALTTNDLSTNVLMMDSSSP